MYIKLHWTASAKKKHYRKKCKFRVNDVKDKTALYPDTLLQIKRMNPNLYCIASQYSEIISWRETA